MFNNKSTTTKSFIFINYGLYAHVVERTPFKGSCTPQLWECVWRWAQKYAFIKYTIFCLMKWTGIVVQYGEIGGNVKAYREIWRYRFIGFLISFQISNQAYLRAF